MRDNDHAARIGLEELLQPDNGFDIEVVGGFVEQQEVGLGEQQFGQHHAHLPASAEGAQGAVQFFPLKAEAFEDALGLALHAAAFHEVQAFVEVGEALQQALIVAAFVILATGELGLYTFELFLHAPDIGKST